MSSTSDPIVAAGHAPPEVKGVPIFGNALDARHDVSALVVNSYHKFAPVFQV